MAIYNSDYVITTEDEIVLLKFVESLRIRDKEDVVFDKLKGDIVISIRTLSGKEHLVSMIILREKIIKYDNREPITNLAEAVSERWRWINRT